MTRWVSIPWPEGSSQGKPLSDTLMIENEKTEIRPTGRVVSWFSCGAASAVATKLAIQKYGDAVEVFYTDTGSEHPDNHRFLSDCEKWFNLKITTLKSDKYSNIWEVFEKKRFLCSPQGAPCTGAMKKEPANGIWKIGDVEVFGYTADEKHRLDRWKKDNPNFCRDNRHHLITVY